MSNNTNKLLLLVGLSALAIYLWSKPGQEKVQEIMSNMRRGERLNNPGNIRKSSTAWQGLAPEQPDSAFASFVSPFYGLRAMAKVLLTYYQKYGLNTVREIVSRYAPSSENDTGAYVATVSRLSGFSPDGTLTLSNPTTLYKIVRAMIQVEQGRVIYADSAIKEAVNAVV